MQRDFSELVFYAMCALGITGLAFGFGLYSGARKTSVYQFVAGTKSTVEDAFGLVADEASTLARTYPKHFLTPTRFPGSGVTVNRNADNGDLILVSGFFDDDNELRLMKRDGSIQARWPVRFSEMFTDTTGLPSAPETDWNVDTHGAVALPDGSIVFNFEYNGLVKLDRCGGLLWKLAHPTHHSVERAEGGGFWVPGKRLYPEGTESPFPPFETPFDGDTVLKVSEAGEIEMELSIPELLYENELEALLTATGHSITRGMEWDEEIIHLNKVGELGSDIADDFPLFEAGDLVVSIRQENLVMVFDPSARKIKWWLVGPWLRQHDPEFRSGGTIVVFNNNTYRTAFDPESGLVDPAYPLLSNIIEADPATGETRIIYGGTEEQGMLSIIRGKVDIRPDNGLMITDFSTGRIFEVDSSGAKVWEYVNRYNENMAAEMTEARIYPAGYFEVDDWSCEVR